MNQALKRIVVAVAIAEVGTIAIAVAIAETGTVAIAEVVELV